MRVRTCLVLFFSGIFSSVFVNKAWAERCDPPAQIAEFIRTLPDNNSQRHTAIAVRLESSPQDFWLNRLFLDSSVYGRSPIREKYRKQFEAHPGNLDDEYLYGRSLVGFNTKEALRIYAGILEKDPDYPWVHYSELEIYRSEVFRDRAKLRVSFDALARVCPAWTEPYRYLTEMDNDGIAAYAARLRTILDASKDPHELKLYTTLWSAEFRVLPKIEWDSEKVRIAVDLKRLSEFDGLHAVIANGAKLIGDDALAKKMTPPRPPDLIAIEQEWQKGHPYPGDDPAKKRAYAEAKLAVSAEWIATDPARIAGYNARFQALTMMDAPVEQIAKAGDEMVRVARTDDRAQGPAFIEVVANSYVERGILLDRVPALIDEALKGFDDPEAVIEIDLAPSHELTEANRMRLASDHVSALRTLSKYYEKLGQMDRARAVLAPLPAYLETKTVPPNAKDANMGRNLLVFHAFAHYGYWERLAELDASGNKPEDALKDYREALLFWDGQRADLLARQRRMWKDLKRSDEDWQTWVDSMPQSACCRQFNSAPSTGPEFTTVHRVLPKVALKDLDGNEWPADRLAAKTTIAVVWATWCGPCLKELPSFAKLAEQLKDRRDVQVVSFNIDENPGLVKAFLDKTGYKFPVLPAKNFAEDLMPYLSIPRTWIIRDGAIVEETEGFGGDGDRWVERVAGQVK